MDDDLWRLRLRRDAFRLPPGRGPASGGCPSFIGKVVSTGANLGVNKYCKVNPVDATGTETESAAGTLTADSSTVVVLALGPTAPATGDYLVCRYVNYRWVAEKQGAGGGSTSPGFTTCCTANPVPGSVTLTFTFRSGTSAATYNNTFQNTGLTYYAIGSAPAYVPAPFGPAGNEYYSPVLTDGSGGQWYYDINCASGTFFFGLNQPFQPRGFSCCTFSTSVCSPFLLTDFVRSGGAGGNFCGFTYGTGTDNMTVS